ncbi:MAG: TonB-dependent receptor [Saprospiraceae bacterium]|nr:TonB-dependent receptor [Saprospiraceae bacterium]
MSRRKTSLIVTTLLCFQFFISLGQVVRGRITGEDKSPLPGIVLKITGTDHQVTTNASGVFRFFNLPKGSHELVSADAAVIFTPLKFELKSDEINLGDINVLESQKTGNSSDIAIVTVDDLQLIDDDDNASVSSLLTSSRDPFDEAAAFNLSNGRFRARGYNNEETELYFNGMPANDLDDGRVFWNSWGGLNDVTRSQTNVLSLRSNDFAFGGVGGATFLDMRASVQRVQTRAVYSIANRSYTHRLMLTHSSGMKKNGWAYSFSLSKRWGQTGYVKGTHYDSYGYYFALDRKINQSHTLSFMAIGAPLRRGKTSAVVQEMYGLAGTNFYNPNWGYQNGEVRNSREDRIHQPIAILRHDWAISKKTRLMTSIGYQFGKYGNTRLDWYLASDPRPDYYKKLPSYQLSEEGKAAVTSYLQGDESNRQLDWSAMYDANYNRVVTIQDANGIPGNSITGRSSAYIVEEQRFDVNKLSINTVLNTNLTMSTTLTVGATLLHEKNHNFKVIDDLLGGDFYQDYDDFALRDFPGNLTALQNDINRPNRLVKEGDIFGYDFTLNTQNYGVWAQLVNSGDNNDVFLSVKSDYASFYREGFMKNGRFPDSSFGKSSTNSFLNYAFKAGDTYKINGRNYVYGSISYRTRAPFSRFAFLSPRIRDEVVSGLTTEKITAAEAGYIFRFSGLSGRLSVYNTQFNDQIENLSYYHDELRTFVNYVTSDISKRHTGMELGLNTKISTTFSIEAALALGQYVYTNRPVATITQDNSSKVIDQDKVIYLKNYRVPGVPQTAGTLGFNYNSPNFWFVSANVNYFNDNYVDINFDRRTAQAVDLVNKEENPAQFYEIIGQEKLDAQYTVDLLAGYSKRIFSKYIVGGTLSVGNVLDNKEFASNGFEQSRYDFATKDVNKFPTKYWYAYGRNYSLNLYLRF